MSRYYFSSALLAGIILLAACKKIDFGEDGGITERDFTNRPIGQVDNSDWTSDAQWEKQELKLFKDLKVDLNGTQQGGISGISLFPNPVTTEAQFSIWQRSSTSRLALVVVDRKYKVVMENTDTALGNPGSTGIIIDFSSLKKGETYRMYYVFYSSSTLYSKGHGDIKLAK